MTERLDLREDGSLELALALLGEDVVFPETPDLAAAFRTQVQEIPRPRPIPVWRWQFASLAAILVVALVFSIPGARSTVAGWLDFAGIRIEIGGDEGGPDDAPSSLGGELFLGRQVSLEEAQSHVSFEVLVPYRPSLVEEPEIYRDHRDGTAVISVLYPASETLPSIGETGAGLLLMQFDPVGDAGLYIKQATGGDSSPEFVMVNGSWGAWIEDGSLEIPPVSNRAGAERPSGHVLIWEEDGVTIRMESNLTQEEAVTIAESLAPVTPPVTIAR